MNIENLLRDRYNREARLMPALLVALPIVLIAFAAFPTLRTTGPALLTLLGTCGVMVWLAHLARDRGSRLQSRLFGLWDGPPSVTALRHRDPLLLPELKARYHAFLTAAIPGLSLPSATDEANDPMAADRAYEAAGAWLREQTRDTKRFKLIFEENVNYGFRRNFWAMKPLAVASSIVALLAGAAMVTWRWFATDTNPSAEMIAVALIIAIYTALLLARVNTEWVRIPAVGYARQLLSACDSLLPQSSSRPRQPRAVPRSN